MNRQDAVQEIKTRWKDLYPAARIKGQIVCPLCGHGTHGDGIKPNPKAKNNYSLKCFTCEFSGSVIDLIMQERGLDFNEATDYAADQLGIVIDSTPARVKGRTYPTPTRPTDPPEDEKATPCYSDLDEEMEDLKIETERVSEVWKKTGGPPDPEDHKEDPDALPCYTAYYMDRAKALRESEEAISYLQARGINEETATNWLLGYDAAWISPTTIKRLEAEGNTWRPDPTKRIIIPISNSHYIARAIDPDIKEYAKMNETGGGSVCIFNEAALKRNKPVFIVEGVFDALSIEEAGASAIALNSTINADKLLEIAQNVKELPPIILSLDNDEAGKKTAEKLKEGLEKIGASYVVRDLSEPYKDPNEALTNAREAFMQRVKEAEAEAAAPQKSHDVMADFLESIQNDTFRPYETGLPFFDNLLGGGVIRQTILLLLAAPGAGKTTLCQQIAEEIARRGRPVVYLNFEMSRAQMLAKGISRLIFLKTHAQKKDKVYSATEILQGYKWTEEQREEILQAAAAYKEEILPCLQYVGNRKSNLDALKEYLREVGSEAVKNQTEAPVVILDYLHLIGTDARIDRQELIRQTVKALKDYAIRYDTFVVAIAAVGRESIKSGFITNESGRDSSNIEYTADMMLTLNYSEVERWGKTKTKETPDGVNPNDPEAFAALTRQPVREMTLRITKNRFAAPGKSEVVYMNTEAGAFYEWENREPEQTAFKQSKTEKKKRL